MSKRDLRRLSGGDVGDWIGEGAELVVLEGRQFTALLHWARIGIERGHAAAAVIAEAGAAGLSAGEGGLFTLDALQGTAQIVRESVCAAEAAVAFLERTECVIVPVDVALTAADGGFL